MPQFSPDQVAFKDLAGYGYWDVGHMREHLQFVQVLAARTTPISIPDWDFLSFLVAPAEVRRSQVISHQAAHDLLRSITGVSGIDLASVNLDDESDFYSWLGYHASEHADIRAALGIV